MGYLLEERDALLCVTHPTSDFGDGFGDNLGDGFGVWVGLK